MWRRHPHAGLIGALHAAVGIAVAITAICCAPLWLAIVATLLGFALIAWGMFWWILG